MKTFDWIDAVVVLGCISAMTFGIFLLNLIEEEQRVERRSLERRVEELEDAGRFMFENNVAPPSHCLR